MKRPRRPAQDLRFAIECLPQRTRAAMLEGIEANSIIVGAYTDRDGGVCPMLAAHRSGGRTSLVSFARAWDRYTRAGRRSRKASEREVHTLKTMLQASLVRDDSVRDELAEAVAELKSIKARRADEAELAAQAERAAEHEAARTREDAAADKGQGAARHTAEDAAAGMGESAPMHATEEPSDRRRPDTGERHRAPELGRHHGWAWLRVFRRYDEYQAALDRVERAEREAERREVERV